MRIQVSGERGEGKTTLINLLKKVLVSAGYSVFTIKSGDIDSEPNLEGIETKVVVIEEIF